MATLALAAVGAAAGSALLPAGIGLLGGVISGATIGSQIGALAGSFVDNALFGASPQTARGPRLKDLHVTASTEGAAIARVYGRVRVGGQVIWASDHEEETVKSGGSGKGMGAGSAGKSITYRYYANFAVAVCEGVITGLGRVWADGKELDLSKITYRVYNGDETQEPDPLIAAHLGGADRAPAFRGTAYVVFERLAIGDFGNRLPQLSFEVNRAVESFGDEVRGVVMIPGSGEFVYATSPVSQTFGGGSATSENVHTRQGETDWAVAVDQLQQELPNARSVSLVVSWFGTDLRAGVCQVRPGVETADKTTKPVSWSVAGVSRDAAYVVSQRDGRAAYGGTPSDASVVAAIRDLRTRGLGVVLTPFVLMDVAAGNALPNPYGGASQPAYPWRGRITVHPAAGQPASADKTSAAAAQITAFVGTAAASHFAVNGDAVVYSGPAEWSYRRMVLHQAHLAKAAGGVEAFVIGTELRGLTTARSDTNTYPFVAALVTLAADVKAVLGPGTKVLYAADWSEYFGHQPGDGTGDVYFHLDPLWASAAIDAIGIDLYWPLADWRAGRAHADYAAGWRSPHDVAYLRSNVAGGEGYDWYYASAADRDAQARSPITDGAGKPWVFRYKDLKSWWLNAHYNRPGGAESATQTAWVPQSKPFWLMEIGCPAVDNGANQPNAFVDPKSSESLLPYYSRGVRDDLAQRRFLSALIGAFDPASAGYVAGLNPVSAVYGGRMVDTDRVHVYAWDARPYPAFPYSTDVWGDGDNWRLGHWLNGRLAAGPLAATVKRLFGDYGFDDFDADSLAGTVPGYVIDRVMSARDALQPLELAHFFDSVETGGAIRLRHRGSGASAATLAADDLVEVKRGEALASLTRAQETELPASAKVSYLSGAGDYRQAVAEARRIAGASGRVSQAELPIVEEAEQAGAIAETWLYEVWAARERAAFAVPPSRIALEPGDLVTLAHDGSARSLRITDIGEHGVREIEARGIDPEVYETVAGAGREVRPPLPVLAGTPLVEFLDLPLLSGEESPTAGWVAATQTPWPGAVSVFGSPDTSGFVLRATAVAPAVMGTTLDALVPGPLGRHDRGSALTVKVHRGLLTSAAPLQLYAGANVAAIRNADGEWEVIQFETATLVAPQTYQLGGLLRGQAGSEFAMRANVAAGAPFVIIDAALGEVALGAADIRLPYNWRYGPAGRDIADPTYGARTHTFAGLGLKPLAPVHVRGRRDGAGLNVSWIRRTRIGGDSWDAADVPLSEDSERYEIDIMDGGTVKRTLTATSQTVLYPAAAQMADFGAVPGAVTVRIYQMSAIYGRGSPATVTL